MNHNALKMRDKIRDNAASVARPGDDIPALIPPDCKLVGEDRQLRRVVLHSGANSSQRRLVEVLLHATVPVAAASRGRDQRHTTQHGHNSRAVNPLQLVFLSILN